MLKKEDQSENNVSNNTRTQMENALSTNVKPNVPKTEKEG